MRNPICGKNEYDLMGRSYGETITLPVSLSNLPKEIEVDGNKLILKEEFHVSLVCIGKIIEKNSINIPDFISKVVDDFCEFTSKNKIEILELRNEFKFVSQLERRSVVVMCDVSNLNKFFDLLNQKYNLSLEYPPTHITLYTLQPSAGIFLVNAIDIDNLTQDIEAPVKLEF